MDRVVPDNGCLQYVLTRRHTRYAEASIICRYGAESRALELDLRKSKRLFVAGADNAPTYLADTLLRGGEGGDQQKAQRQHELQLWCERVLRHATALREDHRNNGD